MTNTTSTRTEDFTAVLNLPARPDTVSALFTSAAGVSRWWGPTEGDGGVGGTLTTSFGEHGVNAVLVVEAGPARVVWQPIVSQGTTPTAHTREWLGTTIEFDIAGADIAAADIADADIADADIATTGTELRFRHVGLTPQLECWDDCFAGWTHFLTSIETLAKTGTGTPFGS